MKSVALHNLGCKVNAYEIDVMQQMLQENGYKIVSFDEKADIYIVNTCSVTNIADRKSRQMLHRAKKKNPEAVVIATGCYVQTGQAALEADACIDLAIGNNRKKEIVQIIETYLREHRAEDTVIDISRAKEYEELKLKQTAGHTRAYIKIQDGCNQFCSYCIIPHARGRVRSRAADNIIQEVRDITAAGYQEIVLTGIHISSYGIDFKEPGALLALIRELHQIEDLKRIRIGSLEPRIMTEDFVKSLREMPKICPHFHLSLQSGCDATLKRMNRRYTAGEYLEKVELLRSCFPNPAIATDVIVGFPGETEEEFLMTKQFLEKIKFYEMHIFKYSRREGTMAAEMKDQIADCKKMERSNQLLELEKKQSAEFRTRCLLGIEEVLFEEKKEIDGKNYWVGHTRQYLKAAAQSEEDLENKIKSGCLTGFLKKDLLLIKI